MSSTICLTLTRYTDTTGPWRKAEQLITWLYPDDTETFRDALEDMDGVTTGPGDSETDEYDCDSYTVLRDGLAKADMNNLIPSDPPSGWDDADIEITIYW